VTFKRDSDRIRHEAAIHGINQGLYLCPVNGCSKSQGIGYTRKDKLTEHLWKKHGNLGFVKRTSWRDQAILWVAASFLCVAWFCFFWLALFMRIQWNIVSPLYIGSDYPIKGIQFGESSTFEVFGGEDSVCGFTPPIAFDRDTTVS